MVFTFLKMSVNRMKEDCNLTKWLFCRWYMHFLVKVITIWTELPVTIKNQIWLSPQLAMDPLFHSRWILKLHFSLSRLLLKISRKDDTTFISGCSRYFLCNVISKQFWSQTCVQRPPLGPKNSGRCWQVVVVQRFLCS